MGKGTIKARKINWLRLFLVKSFGATRPDLSSDCATDYRVYTTSRGVNDQRTSPHRTCVGRGSFAGHRAQHYPDLKQEISDSLSLELLKQSTPASTLGSGPRGESCDRLQATGYYRIMNKKKQDNNRRLSQPSKMPGPAHNLPAVACKIGAKLVKVPGSVCAGCYAPKGRYRFSNVQQALQRRLAALEDPRWVDAMVVLIKDQDWFRWHDSGDIQSLKHLENIFQVCKRTSKTRHWMPTREAQFLKQSRPCHDSG